MNTTSPSSTNISTPEIENEVPEGQNEVQEVQNEVPEQEAAGPANAQLNEIEPESEGECGCRPKKVNWSPCVYWFFHLRGQVRFFIEFFFGHKNIRM
jgi:hypothetical protein